MNFKNRRPTYFFSMITCLLLVAGCISDPGLSKNRGLVKDFSIVNGNTAGCGASYLIIATSNTCSTTCAAGSHLATATELAAEKTKDANDPVLLGKINGSAGICVADVTVTARPTNQIDIKSDFCSCMNGKSDLISDCSNFCANMPTSTSPILYLNTIIGTDIALNTKLGNLYNWCTVQLDGDSTTPQCFISATDGVNTISNIPVTITPGSNSLSANIQQLALNKTYIVKIVEGKTGSNAQSKEFQLRRTTPASTDSTQIGALKITPINQYTCMTYGGYVVNGQILRTSYARVFYYFAANQTPPPIPPAGGNNQSQVVCHDEQLHPGNDSAQYDRLEMIPQLYTMWDMADPRFVNSDNTVPAINKTIMARLLNEHGVTATNIDLFKLINFPNRPTTPTTSTTAANIPLGYIMIPFADANGKTFCPTQSDFNGNDPLFNILKDYMDDTEGLYLAEKEGETILDNGTYKTIYGTMFITETVVKKYGFYIENGLKVMAYTGPTQNAMNTKTIYYYWPIDSTMDPMAQGNRKLFTIRTPSTLNGNVPTGQPTNLPTTDKRIGCVPKSRTL